MLSQTVHGLIAVARGRPPCNVPFNAAKGHATHPPSLAVDDGASWREGDLAGPGGSSLAARRVLVASLLFTCLESVLRGRGVWARVSG